VNLLSFTDLREGISSVFRKIPDWRQQSKVSISLHDALMSGLACMYFQDPSLLQFQKHLQDVQHKNNLQTLFGVQNIPKETQMRDIIDNVESSHFQDVFKKIHSQLQQNRLLEQYQLFPDLYLFPFDGTSYFSSEKVHCAQCLTKKHRTAFFVELLSEIPSDATSFNANTYVLIYQDEVWKLMHVDDNKYLSDVEISAVNGLCAILEGKTLSKLATEKNKKQIKKILTKHNAIYAKVSLTYSHQALQGGIMHPDQSMLIPFMPEEISNSDGSTKQDCEMNAAKRLIDNICQNYSDLKFIFGGDSLFSKQPIIEHILSKNAHYLFSVKLTDHKYLEEWLAIKPALMKMEYIDEKGNHHYYEWMNHVPLNMRADRIRINFIRYKMTSRNSKLIYQNHWVTDLEITNENIKTLVTAGRCRWKAENECFNVLKNHGYNLEHSYGHGEHNLCFNFYLLTLLGFFMHQIFELTDAIYQAVRKKLGSKKNMWDKLRAYIGIIVFDTWEALLNFALTPPRYTIAQARFP
jgi:hypothetical protein